MDRRPADQENVYNSEDVFATVGTVALEPLSLRSNLRDPPSSRKPRRPFSPLLVPRRCTGEENKEGDAWIDTDIDGSEVDVGSDTAAYDST